LSHSASSFLKKKKKPKTFFFFFLNWGLNSVSTPWATPPALFCDGFFEIGAHKLFARAGFKPCPPDLCLLSS
jgi:hypothetical protein